MIRSGPIATLSLVMGLLAATASAAGGRGLTFGPAPGWVEPLGADTGPSPDPTEISGGVHYLLIDEQMRVSSRGEENFTHFATRIVTEAGLDSHSQISMTYDPTYESVEVHFIRLRRGRAVLNRLVPQRFEVVQRETELEAQIYDGALSAIAFVEDLRVGDVIEYAYTTRGSNPVLEGRYTDSFDVEWSVPVRHWRFRLLWPRARVLNVRNHGTSIAPEIDESGAEREYQWELEEVAPVEDPGPVPVWYPAWAWVQLSEFGTWADVAAWARRLYPVPRTLAPPLAAEVERFRALPGPEARARAALRFVQDEVRYLGIEMGMGSHRPSAPEVVLARRFGDCKDKSLLLTTLLGALGVSARPALVSTGRRSALDDWLPTPYAFNHVVTRAEIGGHVLWLDPTRSAQGGSIEDTYFPPYERALVVDDQVEGLTVIPIEPPERPLETVEEDYEIGDDEAPVAYTVMTRLEGRRADGIRYDLRSRSREDVARGYLEYYERIWPGITPLGPVEIEDDRDTNVVLIRERYSIPTFWSEGRSAGRRQGRLRASTLSGYLRRPDIASYAPLAVAYPAYVRHVTRVKLPGDWGLEPESTTLETPAARFTYRARPEGESLSLEYEYRALAGSVPSEAVEAHLARVDEMWNRLGYDLSRPAGGRLGGTNWIAALTLVLGLALAGTSGGALLWLAPPRVARAGTRGWGLVASVFLGALLAAAVVLHGLAVFHAWHLCRPASWGQRTLADGTLHDPLWAPFLLSRLVVGTLLVAVALALLLLHVRGRMRGRAFVGWAYVQTGLLFAGATMLAALPGGENSGLDAEIRLALLSLLPLLPGAAVALWTGSPRRAARASRSRP